MSLESKLADLTLRVSEVRLEPLQLDTKGGWTRHTTVVRLSGGGVEGVGEDVTYGADDQKAFQACGDSIRIDGTFTLAGFSRELDRLELFSQPPENATDRLYRRWAFESAALDLALRQAGRSLAEALGRDPKPLTFVVSLGLGSPATLDPIRRVQERFPDMRFKVDLAENWTRELVRELAETGAVAAIDLKGQYHGSFKGPAANVDQYRWVAESFPDAWIEDPNWNEETTPALETTKDRITWDAQIHSLADIVALPFEPRAMNIKPSRFGFLSELLRTYEYCEARDIRMYGGGQFELGPGRGQIQLLASLFHPDSANDVAPSAFNRVDLPPDLPKSPLAVAPSAAGFAPLYLTKSG